MKLMTRPVAGIAAILLSGGAIFGTAAMANAEEAPPVDETTILVEPEVTPEEAPVLEESFQSQRVSSVVTEEKLAICHSGSGANWTFIEPDANGYNGHQNHDLDIYGLTEAECLAKNVIEVVKDDEDVDYVTVAWLAGDAPPNHFDTDQLYLFSEETEEANLNTLDDEIQAYLASLKCGTDADLQVDVYIDDEVTASLIAGAVLHGPNNPTEHLAFGAVDGNPWKFVHIDAPACPEITECETATVQPTSTNLDAQGWTLVGGEYVEGGVEFTASNWSDAYAVKDTSFPLSAAANLDFDVTGGNVWAIILETTAGNVHYEPEPYTDDLWTNSAGILPANAGGQGGPYSGNLEDIISDPTVTKVYLYFTSGNIEPESAVLHSGSYNCLEQPFDYENVPVVIEFDVQGPVAQCGIAGEFPGLPELPAGVTREVTGGPGPGTYTVTFTALVGYVISGQSVFEIDVPAALDYQNENSEAPCFVEPKQKRIVDGASLCGERTFLQTTTVFTLDPATGQYDNGVSSDARVPVKDFQLCDGLAFTGANANMGMLGLLGVFLLLAGALAVLIRSQHRHSAE